MTANLKVLYSIHWVNFIEVTVSTTTMIFSILILSKNYQHYYYTTFNCIFQMFFVFFFCRGGWIWTNVNQLTFQHVISVRVYAPFIRFVIHSHRYLKTYLTFYGVFDSHQIKHTLLTFLLTTPTAKSVGFLGQARSYLPL